MSNDFIINVNVAKAPPETEGSFKPISRRLEHPSAGLSLPDQLRAVAAQLETFGDLTYVTDVRFTKPLSLIPPIGTRFNYIGDTNDALTALRAMGIDELPDVVVTVGGKVNAGKTTVAALIRQLLSDTGVAHVDSLNADGDQAIIAQHIAEQLVVLSTKRVLILDNNPRMPLAGLDELYSAHRHGCVVNVEQQVTDPYKQTEEPASTEGVLRVRKT